MVFTFHDLPYDLCKEILWEWIVGKIGVEGVTTIRSLDVAYCNHEQRPQFLSWIRDIPLRISFPCKTHAEDFHAWITARHMRIKDLTTITSSTTDIPAIIEKMRTAELLIGSFKHLESARFIGNQNPSAVSQILSSTPVLEHLYIPSYNTFPCVNHFIQQLPNPLCLHSLEVSWQDSGPDDKISRPWWTLTPNLTHLNISLLTIGLHTILPHLSTSLINLEELHVSSATFDRTPDLPSIQFPHLKALSVCYSLFTSEALHALLHGCQDLVHLTLRRIRLLESRTETQRMHLPQLRQLHWEHSLPPKRMSWFTLTWTAPEGMTLPTISPNVELLISIWDTPFKLMEDLLSDVPCRPDAFVFQTEPQDVELWTQHAQNLEHITCMCISGDSDYSLGTWVTILTLPRLTVLKLSGTRLTAFDIALQMCSLSGIKSKVSELSIDDPVCCESTVLAMLCSVFPALSTLYVRKHIITQQNLIYLFRLPKLEVLEVNNEQEQQLSVVLNGIKEETWEQIAEQTNCTTLRLARVSITGSPAIRRLVDSSLGRKLVRLHLGVPKEEAVQWRELKWRESAYLTCRGRCRITFVILSK